MANILKAGGVRRDVYGTGASFTIENDVSAAALLLTGYVSNESTNLALQPLITDTGEIPVNGDALLLDGNAVTTGTPSAVYVVGSRETPVPGSVAAKLLPLAVLIEIRQSPLYFWQEFWCNWELTD